MKGSIDGKNNVITYFDNNSKILKLINIVLELKL